ncbi:TPA: arginine N-succinyltransferase [Salmonella enterica]|uniref:Arginine N-succinyltransferase n=15 Tax=Salmonella enterica TaxID=28901 RepID=A0A3Z7QM62_SALET|nr:MULTISPECIES: arginine N-succinyltransferase [Salmonella]AXQ03470.1 arginine N-succinyltransferase [Salmonella enterica subsp. enterica serovar Choleraesuis str. ATCC 10708]EAA9666163.1 arginine N-succinyltransferase [Salmonella enterica subsp. enterica serovar Infantis]EBA0170514.1 arginine N-succinyltransferase [Salmonella enterica subsp. enterica serovar Enteritidis]EBX2444905.1 arginine N-succinyltransferase [Salmonella enterica subsp. enterica serovar Hissar]ECK9452802.1 arginine N-suc
MRVIRPVEHADIAALMQLAGKTGGGLTSLPANEATLAARIERALKTWSGELPKGEQGYVFVLEDSETGEVGGICAIEVAVGLNDPWYNYRVGTLVHASKELNVYNALPTLFLSNDHTGSSELCTLFLDPEWRKEGNGYLLSKSRFMFMAAFRDKFNEKVVAEMRGVIDEHGYSPFWQSLGKRFFSMDLSRADFLCGTGQKAFIAELMPKHPIYTHFLSEEAQAVIGEVHPQTAPARAVLEKEGFRYRHYIDIFDGGPTLECDNEIRPARYPARQSREASEAVARLNQVNPQQVIFAQQNPEVIDQGVFHNDVIAVSNRQVLFCHEAAFARQKVLINQLRTRVDGFMAIEVPAGEVSVSDAVATYLFNSQLLSRDDGSMLLVLPRECQDHVGVWRYLNKLVAEDNPISAMQVFDLRESMANGGGPACLRLRVVLTEEERRAVNPAVMMNDALFTALNAWADRYYRDRLTAADLADPLLLREGREALDVLTRLLDLGAVYPFQQTGAADG